jgi:hypothetical protein
MDGASTSAFFTNPGTSLGLGFAALLIVISYHTDCDQVTFVESYLVADGRFRAPSEISGSPFLSESTWSCSIA